MFETGEVAQRTSLSVLGKILMNYMHLSLTQLHNIV
jgi:hypothetical protein